MNKICTSIEQGKKLVELGIDISTADMFWADGERPAIWNNKDISLEELDIPAWSLSALLEIIPFPHLSWYKYVDGPLNWNCVSIPKLNSKDISPVVEVRDLPNAIDACYELILKLHDQNLL